jgi:hypothetical protein
MLVVGLVAVVGAHLAPEPAQPVQPARKARPEPLVVQVRKAIDLGVHYLKRQQRDSGKWDDRLGAVSHPGGPTCLALLALLNAGVPVNDPVITRGLTYIRTLTSPSTYVRALQTMVFVEAGLNEDRGRVQRNVDHLVKSRIYRGGKLDGWGYDFAGNVGIRADNSNTQYAVLALYMGRVGKAKIDPAVWEEIRDFYRRTQNRDGGWSYGTDNRGAFGETGSTLTMTTAGLSGLLISGLELNKGREVLRANGTAKNCGKYDEIGEVQKALSWISSPELDRFQLTMPGRTFYNLYGIERAGRLSGLRFFHSHDWYREGCIWLVSRQNKGEGFWAEAGSSDAWPIVSTSFALLFLSKGRTPVLISKLAHGDPVERQTTDLDWNNDRNDCRHLTEFVFEHLFDRKVPLAWQTFDMLRATEARPGRVLTEQDILDVTADLLQSPIVYFNGHESPRDRFTATEKKLLKEYVENGGFILAEACCGSKKFDRGFRQLIADDALWPDTPLEPLPAEHPVWKAHYDVDPGSFKLHGLQMGCKTVLIYAPEDLSCLWEQNRPDTPRGQLAFRMGVNIVAYATGKEPPRPRLARVDLIAVKDEARAIRRGFLKVAQLQHEGDWKPAPRAMAKLMAYLREHARVDVSLKTETMPPHVESVKDFKFVYMHGRRDFTEGHNFTEAELANLRFNLENGGLLFADACCGKKGFDKGFRKFVAKLLPKHKLAPINAEEELKKGGLFSKKLNGLELTRDTIRCRTEAGQKFRSTAPDLEGIKINGRWAVIYSRYDIGCALERHSSSNCLGYEPESAERIAAAAVLYTLEP